MAINVHSGTGDSSACSSPRYSFSNDLPQHTQEQVQINRLDMSLLSSSSEFELEFNFCVDASFPDSESFPADDLFYNGVIIPTQMKQKLNSMQQQEVTSVTTATIIREEKRSFWRFRRSSSLNCENYGHKKSSSSWSIPLLFRSKSTGSSSNDTPMQAHKNSSSNNGKLMNNSKNDESVKCSTSSCQKPPLKKSSSGGGVRVCSSSLNVPLPPPYITKGTSDLLGFSSLFRNGSREKKSKI